MVIEPLERATPGEPAIHTESVDEDSRRSICGVSFEKKQFWIDTYGCQMNIAESASLESSLLGAGWGKARGPQDADLVVVHTCAVRESAERRVHGRIGELGRIKKEHDFTLVLSGCMAAKLKDERETVDKSIDYLVGPLDRSSFIEALCQYSLSNDGVGRATTFSHTHNTHADDSPEPLIRPENAYQFEEHYSLQDQIRAFVPIMHGCNNFCAYCIVPYVRGREVSRSVDAILQEVCFLRESGVREITLLGQNVNSYAYEAVDFPTLLGRISQSLPDDVWIRFLSPHPKDFSEELIDVIAKYPNVCTHVHLPVQHGSDRILTAMNRKYDRSRYLNIIRSLRTAVPEIAISTDILVGFPGEDESDFEATLTLLEEAKFDDAFTYYYNRRKGTEADTMSGHIPHELKLERLERLIRFQRNLSHKKKLRAVGCERVAFAEGRSKRDQGEILCRTDRNEMVIVSGDESSFGSLLRIRFSDVLGSTFRGEVLSCHGD